MPIRDDIFREGRADLWKRKLSTERCFLPTPRHAFPSRNHMIFQLVPKLGCHGHGSTMSSIRSMIII